MNEWTCECLLCARVSVLLCIWLITTFKEYFNGTRQFASHPFNQYAMRITHTRLICVKQLIIFNAFSIARVCILLLPFIDFPFNSVRFDWNANHILIWARSVIPAVAGLRSHSSGSKIFIKLGTSTEFSMNYCHNVLILALRFFSSRIYWKHGYSAQSASQHIKSYLIDMVFIFLWNFVCFLQIFDLWLARLILFAYHSMWICTSIRFGHICFDSQFSCFFFQIITWLKCLCLRNTWFNSLCHS